MTQPKPILFLLNDRWRLQSSRNTTGQLIIGARKLGHPVFVSDVVHLQASSSTELFVEALQVPDEPFTKSGKLSSRFAKATPERISLLDLAAVFVRTTPGKDIGRAWAHRVALEVLRMANETGVAVINKPVGLQRASSKLYTVCLPPEFVPRTMVCHSLTSVKQFVAELDGPFVMKPLIGSQGRDVFFHDGPDSLNTRQVVDILGRTGYLIVQEYVPEASEGDIRVLTLGRDLVISGGRPLGIRRIPADGERRSNVSLGGRTELVELTDRQVHICQSIARVIVDDGILFSGLDLIGDKIVEVNVFSPSGLQEFAKHADPDIGERVLTELLASPTGTPD